MQTLEKPVINHKTDGITTGEYRSAMKGESWKIDLINNIDEVMKQAKTQKQFCFLMRQKGYIAPPTKPCRQILGIKKISQRQKNLKCGTIPAFFFLDKFPFYFRLFGKV